MNKDIGMWTRYTIVCVVLLLTCNTLFAECMSDEEYSALASKFYSWEKGNADDSLLRQQIKIFNTLRALENYTQSHEYAIDQDNNHLTYIDKILIIVKNNVYSAIPLYIIRYAHDIHNAFGCAVDIVSVNGETAPQIRALIQSYSTNLDGTVLIGDIIPAFYYHPDSIESDTISWEEETFPCDLYYMDINGTWQLKNDGSGAYDGHTGNVKPEIFVGRINTATMGRDEIQELIYYFDKDHQYWTGQKALNKQRALTFTGPDWNNTNFWDSVAPLYGNNYYDVVQADMFNKHNYINYLQNNNYEFVQLACHSNVGFHNFQTTTDSLLYGTQISNLQTKQIGYNLFCCKACNWDKKANSQCLGESYLYGQNNNSSALTVIGSTKTGGMYYFSLFYRLLGIGRCIGEAHKQWWKVNFGDNHDINIVHWFYGMTILGDPLINFNFTNDCDDILTLNGGEESASNNMYYAQSKIIVQNYSLTEGQSVTLSAPTIQINGPFTCNSASTFTTNINDHCVCNSGTRNHQRTIRRNASTHSDFQLSHDDVTKPLTIFPNPAHDILNIQCNEPIASVSLFNINGQCVLRTKHSQINISHLPQGLYFIRVTTETEQILQTKIIHL